jgi:hypothetical protein
LRVVDGAQLCVLTSKVPLLDREGHVTGVLNPYEDVTKRKRGEEATSQDRTRLQFRVRDNGIGVKAEDLNNLFVEFREGHRPRPCNRRSKKTLDENSIYATTQSVEKMLATEPGDRRFRTLA